MMYNYVSDFPECDKFDLPCYGHGNCYELRGSYRCDCSLGWKGTFCEMGKSRP